MRKIKELRKEKKNGINRSISLWVCDKCGTEQEGRSDMVQTTPYCRACSSMSHGMEGTKVYSLWLGMKARCYNKKSTRYVTHGARGVTVCKEWMDASTFIAWAYTNGFDAKEGERNTEYTLDRKNNDGNYTPSNCRITSLEVQQWNKQRLAKNNTSGYRGVTKKGNRWIAQLNLKGKVVFRGSYATSIEAAKAREEFIVKHKLPHILNNLKDL